MAVNSVTSPQIPPQRAAVEHATRSLPTRAPKETGADRRDAVSRIDAQARSILGAEEKAYFASAFPDLPTDFAPAPTYTGTGIAATPPRGGMIDRRG